MNIFATTNNAREAARHLDDLRLRKMLLETAQMIFTVAHERGHTVPMKPLSKSHKNHPCVIWSREPQNMGWLLRYFVALSHECSYRFGKRYRAAVQMNESHTIDYLEATLVAQASDNYHLANFENVTFVNCTTSLIKGFSYKSESDVHLAYRKYITAKLLTDNAVPRYSRRPVPDFVFELSGTVGDDLHENKALTLYSNKFYERNAAWLASTAKLQGYGTHKPTAETAKPTP